MNLKLQRVENGYRLLNKEVILDLFDTLNIMLRENNLSLSLTIYGGTMMNLLYDIRPATHDIDCIISSEKEEILLQNILHEVGKLYGLEKDWINEEIAKPLTTLIQEELSVLNRYSNLTIIKPSKEQLLAMKVLSARVEPSKDFIDAELICRDLGITTEREIYKVVKKFLPMNVLGERQRMFIKYTVEDLTGEKI